MEITKTKLLNFFNDNEKKSKLKIELANIIIDYGEVFVKAIYNLGREWTSNFASF